MYIHIYEKGNPSQPKIGICIYIYIHKYTYTHAYILFFLFPTEIIHNLPIFHL